MFQEKKAMKLTLNGEPYETTAETVGSLLEELKIQQGRVAVEVNLVIIKRAGFDQHRLAEGDAVEVVNFVGGG